MSSVLSGRSVTSMQRWGIPNHETHDPQKSLLDRLMWVRYRTFWWPAIMYYSYAEMQQHLYDKVDMVVKAQFAMAIMRQMQEKRSVKVARLLGRSALEVVELEEGMYCEFYWCLSTKIEENCNLARYEGDIELFVDFHRALDQIEDIFREVSIDCTFMLRSRTQEESWMDEALYILESRDDLLAATSPRLRSSSIDTFGNNANRIRDMRSSDYNIIERISAPTEHRDWTPNSDYNPSSSMPVKFRQSQRTGFARRPYVDAIPESLLANYRTSSASRPSFDLEALSDMGRSSTVSRRSMATSRAVAAPRADAMETFLNTLNEPSESSKGGSISRPSVASAQAVYHFERSASDLEQEILQNHTESTGMSSTSDVFSRSSHTSHRLRKAKGISSFRSGNSKSGSRQVNNRSSSSQGNISLSYRQSLGLSATQPVTPRERILRPSKATKAPARALLDSTPDSSVTPISSITPPSAVTPMAAAKPEYFTPKPVASPIPEISTRKSKSSRQQNKGRRPKLKIPQLSPEQIPTRHKKIASSKPTSIVPNSAGSVSTNHAQGRGPCSGCCCLGVTKPTSLLGAAAKNKQHKFQSTHLMSDQDNEEPSNIYLAAELE